MQYYSEHKGSRPEQRGGSRNTEQKLAVRKSICNHISKFTCKASHYGRKSAPGKKYLSSDLSIRKMHDLYLKECLFNVSYNLYLSVFHGDFNLGFGRPATDVCATCVSYKRKLKDVNSTKEERLVQAATYLLHRRKARAFYDKMNDVQDSCTLCFDIMENLVLPKTTICESYYSRQLYIHVLCIVRHAGKDANGKGNQNKEDVHFYVWGEHEAGKGSNMIASALEDSFKNVFGTLLDAKDTLRLFSDSCFGQNKNVNVLSMLFRYNKLMSNLDISYTFPIRGHSFLPADRIFGGVEQEIKKRDTILLPEEYHDILRNHGIVHVYNTDWRSYDFKSAATSHIKAVRSFKISDAKVLALVGDKLLFKSSYNAGGCVHSILKKGKKWSNLQPDVIGIQSQVTTAKKKDVMKLLELISAPNDIVDFYNSIEIKLGQNEEDDLQ